MECVYCGRESEHPCMNTRDMEQYAIDGNTRCFDTLDKLGGGERGIDRVDSLRKQANNQPY